MLFFVRQFSLREIFGCGNLLEDVGRAEHVEGPESLVDGRKSADTSVFPSTCCTVGTKECISSAK